MSLPLPHALTISRLDACRCHSPLHQREEPFVNDRRRALVCSDTEALQPYLEAGQIPPAFEMAGPRAQIFFEASQLTCGIVTCGGLCPGLNNVIRSVVLTLTYVYGVPRILGFRYGYGGLAATSEHTPLLLTPAVVEDIHEHGGTLLGSSRGPQDVGGKASCRL